MAELTSALDTPPEVTDLLLNYYASFGSRRFFDVEFAGALKDVRDNKDMQDADKAQHALEHLILQAQQDLPSNEKIQEKNKTSIYAAADKYHLSVKITAALLAVYTVPGAVDFAEHFDQLIKSLTKTNPDEKLCASLAAKVMLCQITHKDAQDIALTSKLLKGQILEEDLMIIACRYLKVKTPQDIQDSFDAVLSRLPHVSQKEETSVWPCRCFWTARNPLLKRPSRKPACAASVFCCAKPSPKKTPMPDMNMTWPSVSPDRKPLCSLSGK